MRKTTTRAEWIVAWRWAREALRRFGKHGAEIRWNNSMQSAAVGVLLTAYSGDPLLQSRSTRVRRAQERRNGKWFSRSWNPPSTNVVEGIGDIPLFEPGERVTTNFMDGEVGMVLTCSRDNCTIAWTDGGWPTMCFSIDVVRRVEQAA